MKKLKLNIQRFSSTNHTANYDLSQYIGTDKPTYLGDYNSDMSKIDANLKLVSDKANSADSKATAGSTTADSALTRANEAYTLADTANTLANTANNTAGTALENSVANATQLAKFNFVNHNTAYRSSSDSNTAQITLGKFNTNNLTFTTTNSGLSNAYCNIQCDTNSDGSLGKIYGPFHVVANYTINASNGYPCIRLRCSDLNIKVPTETYTIWSAGTCISGTSVNCGSITISSDGYVYIYGNLNVTASSANYRTIYNPCIYFFEDFGNTIDPGE